MPSAIHTGLAFRGNGGAVNSSDQSLYYRGTEVMRYNATVLTMTAGDFRVSNGQGLTIGYAGQETVSTGDGATDLIPELQVLGTGQADGSMLLGVSSATATRAAAPTYAMYKSGNAAIGSHTIVTSGEILGSIIAYGDDGVDLESPAGAIEFACDGTPGTGDMPGRIVMYTTPDSGETLTEAWRISNDQNTYIAAGNGLVVGHTAGLSVSRSTGGAGHTPEFQILGATQSRASTTLGLWSADADGAILTFSKSRNATVGSSTIVADNDELGAINFGGDDGTDFISVGASIRAYVDGTPGDGDMPGRLSFYTTVDGAQAATERWRITSVGYLTSLAADAANAANVDGGIIATGGMAFTDVANAWIDDATRGSGTVTHYIGNQSITTSSDLRIKTEVVDWNGQAMDLLKQAHIVEYTYNMPGGGASDGYGPNGRGRYVGMLAQETIKWAPWVVNAGAGKDCPECSVGLPCNKCTPDGFGEHAFWHVDYDHLIPLIIRGTQELDERVMSLEVAQAHTANGWLKEQFTELVEKDANFRAWAQEKLIA
jgi:hypothetical protein